MAKIWRKTKEWSEGKFLVVRRDGTAPAWPYFVLGARDQWASVALRAYAAYALATGGSKEFCDSVLALVRDFDEYRADHGAGDPEATPHRSDDPNVIMAMRGGEVTIRVRPDPRPSADDVRVRNLSHRALMMWDKRHDTIDQELGDSLDKHLRAMEEVVRMVLKETGVLK